MSLPTIHNQLTKLYEFFPLPFETSNNTYFAAPTYQYYVTVSDFLNNATIVYALSPNDVNNCLNVTFGLRCSFENSTIFLHSLEFYYVYMLLKHEECYYKTLSQLNVDTNACAIYKASEKTQIIELAENVYYAQVLNLANITFGWPRFDDSFYINRSIVFKTKTKCSVELLKI